MKDCPACGEPDMMRLPAEDQDEVDLFECPECGTTVPA